QPVAGTLRVPDGPVCGELPPADAAVRAPAVGAGELRVGRGRRTQRAPGGAGTPSLHLGTGTHLRFRRCAHRPPRAVGAVAHVHRRPRGRGAALPSRATPVAGAWPVRAGTHGVSASPANERVSRALAGIPGGAGTFRRYA